MTQQPLFLVRCAGGTYTQRIAAGAGSHGAVGRGGSVRLHRATGWTIQNRPQSVAAYFTVIWLVATNFHFPP